MEKSISKSYAKLLESLSNENTEDFNSDLTYQIFYDLFKIRVAQKKYKEKTNRYKNYSLSDIFQDIIAHYLRLKLSQKEYKIYLEKTSNKLRPDILIEKNNKNWAIIEVKTNLGWNRHITKKEKYLGRLKHLKKEFKDIPLERIFYVIETSSNVNKEFASIWSPKNKNNKKIKKHILPLFNETAEPKNHIKKNELKGYSEKQIHTLYVNSKITNFKDIIKKVEGRNHLD